MALVVQKYGGTSVGSVERIHNVARRCLEARARGDDVVVVVSAMSGETNRLVDLVKQINPNPSEREHDVVVSAGEQVSIGLLALAIQAQGGKAQSFLGSQVKILTDSAYSRARIRRIHDERLQAALDEGAVAVVAGFQGVDPDGNITTLGRGGSDTSAVALAAALGADACEIYTDVDGVYTTDPRIVPEARKLDKVSYEEMLELASLGAKVLQIRSVAFAMKYQVPLWVRSSFEDVPGTLVCDEDDTMEERLLTGIAYDRHQAKIALRGVPDRPGTAEAIFEPLARAGVVVDMIVQNASKPGGRTDVTFTVARTDLENAKALIEEVAKDLDAEAIETDARMAKVSVVGVGMRTHAGIAAELFQTLAAEGINVQMISTSEIKVSVVIDEKYVELAVRSLHSAFGLDEPR